MNKIDYQALREAAEKATWGDWDSYKPHRGARGYEVRLSSQAIAQHVLKNNAEFIAAFNPKIALALLDERERNQQYIKRRDQENEMMVDAMHAAIALTSVGIDLDDYDECVLRLHEWGALPDYCIALYVDFVHGIVSKNKLLDFGYINGAPVWTLRDELEAAKSKLNEKREYYEGVISDGSKRIAELQTKSAPDSFGIIGENIRTQDNRITSDPMFCVYQKREIVVDADYDYDRIVWVDEDGNEANKLQSRRLELLHENFREPPEKWRRVAVKDIDEFVTCCFTEQGCKDYLAVNGHNLRLPFIYVKSGFRNAEYIGIRNWLAGIRIKGE
ncbi:TPA: ead/Ea22-like family protein [Escherichia coli]|nr:ead/Ea22-like family protein [Escherichia coli]